MKTLARSLIGAATLAFAAGAATAETTKVGIAAEPYPPFTVPTASGTWTGWEIEIMDALCARAELDCEVAPTSWDGIIPALTSGRIDLIIGSMSITEERQQTIDFSDKYYNTPSAIVAAKGSGISPDEAGLSGKLLGVQVSTIHERYAKAHFPDAEIKVYQTQDEANQDLVSGRLDAVEADAIALDAFLASDAGSACCGMMGDVAPDEAVLGAGIGVGLRKGDEALKAKINDAIAGIRADGTYEAITKKYFAFDIYGG